MALAACASAPPIKHQILTPPPSAPRAEFFVERPDVQSREVGDEAWQRNEQYGRLLYEALRTGLTESGKRLVPPPANSVRSRVYLAYGAAPVKSKARGTAHVEVRLQLLDASSGAVVYSTHTQAPIAKPRFGAADADAVIREVLQKAAQDFVSRL